MANHRECQFRRIGQIMPNPWDTLRYQPVHGARVDGYEALRGATMGEERGKPSFRRSLVDGRVRMPVGHRRCTRRKVTIGSGCRKLAGFASNGPCWYRVGYRAGRGGISGRSVAAQYDPTLRLYLTPPYVPYPPLFLSVQLSLFAIGRISNGRVSSNPTNADLFDSEIDRGRNVMEINTYGDVSFD